jgi:hypothetical protein
MGVIARLKLEIDIQRDGRRCVLRTDHEPLFVGRLVACATFYVPEKEPRHHRLVARFQPILHGGKHESAIWLLKSQFHILTTNQIW